MAEATPHSLTTLLHRRASAAPEHLAFVVDGGPQLTFGGWERRSVAIAGGLRRRGIGHGDRVVLHFDSRHWTDFAVAYAGVAAVGGVSVPLPAHLSHIEVARVVAHSATQMVLDQAMVVELEGGGGDVTPATAPAETVELSYRSRGLQPPQCTPRTAAQIMQEVAELAPEHDGPPRGALVHSFAVGTDGARLALWLALAGADAPVVTLPAFDPERFCAATAEHRARRWALTTGTVQWLSGSGATERHDVSSVVDVILCDRREMADTEGEADPLPPVAASQEGMLWHEQFSPGSQNLPPLVRRYEGGLDVEAFAGALSDIVARHAPLRSTFAVRRGRAVQVVAPPGDWTLPVVDLTHLDPTEQDDELARVLADAGRPFDLVTGPLFEATLLRLGHDDHLAVVRTHHSVFDDWSVGVFRRELSAFYAARVEGRTVEAAELALDFPAFARGQHRRLSGPTGAQQLAWWKDHLAGAPLCLQLPIGDPGLPPGSPQPSARPVVRMLPPPLTAQVRALAGRQRVTTFMVVLAGFQVLARRWTGQSELLLASVVANRNRTELEGLIGCFTKKILLRHSLAGDPTFADVLARTRPELLGAISHQDLPFERVLQEALGAPAAGHGVVPYPVVMVQGVTPEAGEVVIPGVTTAGYDTAATTTRAHFMAGDDNFPHTGGGSPWGGGLYSGTFLILSIEETGHGVRATQAGHGVRATQAGHGVRATQAGHGVRATQAGATLTLTARGAFHGPVVERLLAGFQALLTEVVDHPFRPLSELVDGRREWAPPAEPDPARVDFRGFRVDPAGLEDAVRRCAGVTDARVTVADEIVAAVEPGPGGPPSPGDVHRAVWSQSPGSAWPAAVVPSGPGSPPAEAAYLAAVWAEVRGMESVGTEENYWQDFSFIEVVARAREAGVPLTDEQVTRNRTVATLGMDLAVAALRASTP